MNEFRAWMQAMGFNGKQVAKAGELIGMGRSTALLCSSGERRVTQTEKLAMAAVSAGFPAWSADRHREISAGGQVVALAKSAFHCPPPQ
jgi:hypothetical protein